MEMPAKHIGQLTDAHSILSWNSIDCHSQWPHELAAAFDIACHELGHLLDMLDVYQATEKITAPARDMIEAAF